jgi:hypothetical protein
VILADLSLAHELGVMQFIHMRFAPDGSYSNPAEHPMNVLNLALNGCALARADMGEAWEKRFKQSGTKKLLRAQGTADPAFATKWAERYCLPRFLCCVVLLCVTVCCFSLAASSMEPTIAAIKERYEKAEWTGAAVVVSPACDQAEADEVVCRNIALIDPDLDPLTATTASLANSELFQDFAKLHCRLRTYTVQYINCGQVDCGFCVPASLSPEQMSSLRFLPDPHIDPSRGDDKGQHYFDFEKALSKDSPDSNDADRPSVVTVCCLEFMVVAQPLQT